MVKFKVLNMSLAATLTLIEPSVGILYGEEALGILRHN